MSYKIKIGKVHTTLLTSWDDITISKAIEMSRVSAPESLEGWGREVVQYAAALFSILCTDKLPGNVNPISLEMYWRSDIKDLAMDIQELRADSYRVKGIDKFKFKGEIYYMPPALVIDDGFIPAHAETAEAFTEAADLLTHMQQLAREGLQYFPALVATFCRKKNEKFSEKLQLERAELFKELPMSIGWEVFFWALRSSVTLLRDSILQSLEVVGKKGWRQRVVDLRRWATGHGYTGSPRARSQAVLKK